MDLHDLMGEAGVRAFARDSWRIMPHHFAERVSGGRWRSARHLEHIGARIVEAVNRGNGRLVVNMPARYGKSQFLSEFVPTWFLSWRPECDVILSGYSAQQVQEHGANVRNIARDCPLVNFRLRQDRKARNRWNTHAGGGMLCAGVGGGITGFGAHLLLIDDPYKNWREAWSTANRRKVEEWFVSTAYKRLHPGGTIVVLHHRFHPRDLSGYLLEHHDDKWEHIRLPKIAEADDPIGRAPGEALWPEMWSQEHVEHERRITPAHTWAAMDQQDPRTGGSGLAYAGFGQGNVDPGAALVDGLPLCVSFDFNRNPGMYCLVGQYDPKQDRFTVVHELHGARWTVHEILKELVKLVRSLGRFRWPGIHVFGDATGGGVSMDDGLNSYVTIRQTIERDLTRQVRVRVPAGNPGHVDSLLTINDAFCDACSERHVKIHPRCEILLHDLRSVPLDADGGIEKTDDTLTHSSDTLRYWVHYVRPIGGRPRPARPPLVGSATTAR